MPANCRREQPKQKPMPSSNQEDGTRKGGNQEEAISISRLLTVQSHSSLCFNQALSDFQEGPQRANGSLLECPATKLVLYTQRCTD